MADPRDVIVDHLQWLERDETNRFLTVHKTSTKIRNNTVVVDKIRELASHVSHGVGMASPRGSKLFVPILQVFFSDRTMGAEGSTEFQPFARDQTDEQEVYFDQSGEVEIILKSWGDAVVPVRELVVPGDGFLSGIAVEPNGVAVVTFAFVRGTPA